jgi:hypothetical protein
MDWGPFLGALAWFSPVAVLLVLALAADDN